MPTAIFATWLTLPHIPAPLGGLRLLPAMLLMLTLALVACDGEQVSAPPPLAHDPAGAAATTAADAPATWPQPAFAPQGTHYFVAPDGQADNPGTRDAPWDIASVWSGQQAVEPGATIYMAGGVYRHPDRSWQSRGYELALAGTQEEPIHIRPIPGERVTIDAPIIVPAQAQHLWVWDLEVTIAETPGWHRTFSAVPHPADEIPDLPQGGVTVHGGPGSKFINWIIHSTSGTGISIWRHAVDFELHGCLIYNHGWIDPQRYHGPGIYTQNEHGTKQITDNIFWGIYSTTIQAYGSANAFVNGYVIDGNIAFAPVKEGRRQRILIGGGRPSEDIEANENILYEVPLQIGYNAPYNVNAVVRDNFIVHANLSISNFRELDESGNTVLQGDFPRPEEPTIFLRPNRYDPNRAHLAIFNWQQAAHVSIDPGNFLEPGDHYRIQSALDYFGPPVSEGVYQRGLLPVNIPAEPRTGDGKFAAFVILRQPG